MFLYCIQSEGLVQIVHVVLSTLQLMWKPLTAVLKLNSELSPQSIDRAPTYNVQRIRIYRMAARSIRTGEKILNLVCSLS